MKIVNIVFARGLLDHADVPRTESAQLGGHGVGHRHAADDSWHGVVTKASERAVGAAGAREYLYLPETGGETRAEHGLDRNEKWGRPVDVTVADSSAAIAPDCEHGRDAMGVEVPLALLGKVVGAVKHHVGLADGVEIFLDSRVYLHWRC